MHYLVPVTVEVPPHQVSGEPAGALPLASALKQKFGHQGMKVGPACNPHLPIGETHRGTGEPWALLIVINGQVCIPDGDDPNTVKPCQACMATKVWKDAYAANPHPQAAKAEKQVASSGGCCGG
jgi:hypothetical protein